MKKKEPIKSILLWLFFLGLIYLIQPRFGWQFPAIGTLLVSFFKKNKGLGMAVVTVISWIFSGHLYFKNIFLEKNWLSVYLYNHLVPVTLSGLLVSILISYVFVHTVKGIKFSLITIFSLFYLGLFAIADLGKYFQIFWITSVATVVVYIITQWTWGLLLLAFDKSFVKDNTFLAVLRLQPYWGNGEQAQVPAGERMLWESEVTEDSVKSRLKRSAINLLLTLLLVRIVVNFFNANFFSNFEQVDNILTIKINYIDNFDAVKQWSAMQKNELLQPIKNFFELFLRWAFFILNHLVYLFDRFYIGFGVPVAAAQFIGFNLPAGVNKPFDAKTMYDYWSRWMPYYAVLVTRFGIEPALSFFSFFKNNSVRIGASIMVGILTVGLLSHQYFYYIFLLPQKGFVSTVADYLNVVPYLIAVGGVLAFSATIERKFIKKKINGRLGQVLRIITYTLIWAFLRSVLLLSFNGFSFKNIFNLLQNLGFCSCAS